MKVILFSTIVVLFTFFTQSSSIFVSPSTFLNARLAKGSWMARNDLDYANNLFEGGWVWSESGNLIVTHICRAKSGDSDDDVSIEPGELLNGTCFISGTPTKETPNGVKESNKYEVLMKIPDEVYEWVDFGTEYGYVPDGGVIGGIGPNYEPILLCRRLYTGTAGNLRKSKAVLGKFTPKDGKCFYELEVGGRRKWDLSFSSETFQILVLRAKGKDACAEPRKMSS